MKRILCYGDSNTYGYNPENERRYPKEIRWTGRLSHILGDNYEIIEEGLNNRTTTLEPPEELWRSGLFYLEPCLRSHIPLDLVIIMLGSNDMKICFQQTPELIGRHIRLLIQKTREILSLKNPPEKQCKILLISPILISKHICNAYYANEFGGLSATNFSTQLSAIYRQIAREEHCEFLSGQDCSNPSVLDGLHMDPEGHRQMAEAVARKISVIF